MKMIYVLGPSKVGKSTFLNKYFPNQRIIDNIIESSERKLPDEYLKVYLILPPVETQKDRTGLSVEEYEKWMNFYMENVTEITLIEGF